MTRLPLRNDYDEMVADFRWDIPERFNIGVACSDAHCPERGAQIALIHDDGSGSPASTLTYRELAQASDALALRFTELGVRRGDRIAIYLPQGFAVAITHLAAYKLGAIAVPLALLFGPEALAYRLDVSGARVLITNGYGLAKFEDIERPAALEHVILDEDDPSTGLRFSDLAEPGPGFEAVDTLADDPAMMIFTSGTTGSPKGALHAHRVLLGHIPGVQTHHEMLPQPGDRLWTPADWAWAGGLLNVLLPGLMLGVPVVSGPFERFDPERALALMARNAVRNAFIPPTALRMLRSVADIRGRFDLSLRTIGSGGEQLGAETLDWGERELGLTINEFYGQTECNLVLSACAALGVVRSGAIGKPVAGHRVAVIDETGREVPDGVSGQIAIKRPDPVMFIEYWNSPEATVAKFLGDYLLTGDQGRRDADGYIHFFGRDDDVIISAGYRIGPGEIEDCLHRHPAVQLSAAVGIPDALRTEIVKAFIVLKPGYAPSEELERDIQTFVRERLSAHEYPRQVAFVDELPMTSTGKIIRRALRDPVSR